MKSPCGSASGQPEVGLIKQSQLLFIATAPVRGEGSRRHSAPDGCRDLGVAQHRGEDYPPPLRAVAKEEI